MTEQSDISLLISTYNWPRALELIFKSALVQSEMPLEIVIADDGSLQETKELIASYKSIFKIPLKHVWHEDNGFQKCLILNKAIHQCSGRYIVQIDGDIILHKDFIKDHHRQRESGFFVAAGRAAIGELKSKEILETGQVKFSVFSDGMDTRFNALHIPTLSFMYQTHPTSSWNVKGCNMAFWKEDFINVNGYFSGFKGWGWEDYEIAQRFINSGIKKKRLKWAAIGYHIYHPLNSRGNSAVNEKVYIESVREKIITRVPGFFEAYNL